jgi:hypothetical protein
MNGGVGQPNGAGGNGGEKEKKKQKQYKWYMRVRSIAGSHESSSRGERKGKRTGTGTGLEHDGDSLTRGKQVGCQFVKFPIPLVTSLHAALHPSALAGGHPRCNI